MAKDASFDIVSKVDLQEVANAINQAVKEIAQRFDLKDSNSTIEWDNDETINLTAPDDMKLRNIFTIVQEKFIKRNISSKSMDAGKMEHALGGKVKQEIKIRQGIDKDYAKKINVIIKNSKLKVNSQIQEDQIRVSAKSIDDLQQIMQVLKAEELDIDLQFINYR
ncbi:MAG: YajQ family cyclic di-GMP-binding protein [Candidatus Sericytochromatia bacterium]|nr:YajQ family cyclic di-GMP-binding protein [Candidatus Sericytochromatia bacterium]